MRRPIVLTDEIIEKMSQEFMAALKAAKLTDGGVKYEKKFVYPEEAGKDKAIVLYEPKAWIKQKLLLYEFSTEVAWHAVVERRDEITFVIKDILVYPQEVTGGTVNTDQELYQKWMMELPDDVYNNLRGQMHSHAIFATTPSSVDLTHQERILDMMGGDDYYIFFIWNKKMEKTVKIYDMENNILYENDDVLVEVIDEGSEMNELISFIGDSNNHVKAKSYTQAGYYSGSAYGGSGYDTTGKKAKEPKAGKKSKETGKVAAQQTALAPYNAGNPNVGYQGQTPGSILDRHDSWYRNLVGDGDDLD